MTQNALSICREFLHSPDPQVRRNAITALAAIGTSESLRDVATATIRDTDVDVRRRAEDELIRHAGNDVTGPAAVFADAFDDPATAVTAYAVVGRLRRRGWRRNEPAGGMWRRLQRARRFERQMQSEPIASTRRIVAPALFGAIGGVIAFGAIVLASRLSLGAGALAAIALTPPVVAITGASVAMRGAQPFGAHMDRAAAALLALGRAVLGGVVVAFFASIPAMIDLGRVLTGAEFALVGLMGVVATAGVRMATIATDGLFSRGDIGRYMHTIVCAAAGMALVTMIALLVNDVAAGAIWAVLVPASGGFALAFLSLDSGAIFGPRGGRRLAARASVGVALLFVGLLLWPTAATTISSSRPSKEKAQVSAPTSPLVASEGTARTVRLPIVSFPLTVDIGVRFPQRLKAIIPEETPTCGCDYKLALRTADGKTIASQDDPPSVNEPLQPGDYKLVATLFGGTGTKSVGLSRVMDALIVAGRMEPRGGPTLVIVLNADAAHP